MPEVFTVVLHTCIYILYMMIIIIFLRRLDGQQIPHHLYYQLVFSEKKSDLIYNT